MSYTAEEKFYGRAVFECEYPQGQWDYLHVDRRNDYIKIALAARAAKYVDPVQAVANKLFVACNGCMPHGGGNAGLGYLKMAEAAIAMGAKP